MSYALGFAPSHNPADEFAEEMRTFGRQKPHLYLVRNEHQETHACTQGNPTKMYQEISGITDESTFESSAGYSQTPPSPPINKEGDEVFAQKALMKYLPSYFYVTNNGWVVPNAKDVELVEVKPYSDLHVFKYKPTGGGKITFGVVPNQETNSAEVSVLNESLTEPTRFGTWRNMADVN